MTMHRMKKRVEDGGIFLKSLSRVSIKYQDNQYLMVKRGMEWKDRSVKELKRANSEK